MQSEEPRSLNAYAGIAWAAIFAAGAATVFAQTFDLAEHEQGLLFATVLLCLYGLLKWKPNQSSVTHVIWPGLALALLAVWFALYRLFGEISINAILFHFNYDVGSHDVQGAVLKDALLAIEPFAMMFVAWSQLAKRSFGLDRVNRLLPFVLLAGNPLLWVSFSHAFSLTQPSPVDLHAEFILTEPVYLRDVPHKNLIHIFLESTEQTFSNTEAFGDVAEPLKRLQQNAWIASNIDQAEMTNWTLAGHVASTCGTPLFPLGVIKRNSFDLVDQVLPSATCLGDVLARNGYTNVFLKGASLDFAGTRGFAASHGYQRLLGFNELRHKFTHGFNDWGLHDEDLFSVAHEEVVSLQASGKPFSLMMTTIGGHAPRGYVSPVCMQESFVARQANETLKAVACTNLLLERFIGRLRTEGLLENTLVVVQSDHLAMRNEVYSSLRSLSRRNLFMVLGSGRTGVETKPATTVDIYPTILKDLGFEMQDGRIGLGYALQDDHETLVGQYGIDGFNQAIQTDFHLRNRLWGLSEQAGS